MTEASNSSFPKSVQPGIPKRQEPPAGWKVMKLRQLLKPVMRPVAMKDDETYQLVKAKRSRGGIVARERLKGREILTKTQFEVRAGDFLISRRQISHGACGLVPPELDGALVSNEYLALRPTEKLDLGYLIHLSHSVYFQQTCFHSSIGVHVEKLVFKPEVWLDWSFNIPPIDEQRRIAAVLDAWDEHLKLHTRCLNACIIEHKHRLSNFEGGSIALGQLASVTMGQSPPSSSYLALGEAGHPLIQGAADFGNDGWVAPQNATRQAAKLVHGPCIVMSVRAPVGAFSEVPEGIFAIGRGVCAIAPHDASMLPLLKVAIGSLEQYWARISQGGTFEAVNRNDVQEAPLYLPPTRLLRPASQVTLEGEEMIRIEAKVNNLLRRQKRGLMQKLLTGEWRVPASIDRLMPGGAEAERLAEAAS